MADPWALWSQEIILLSAAIGALMLMWTRLMRAIAWIKKKGSQFMWAFSEQHDHQVINDKLDALVASIEEIKAEYKPNGGGSQADKLDKILETMEFQKGFFHATLDTHSTAFFRTDETGGVVWVNRAFCRLMGVTPEEVMHFGFVNILDNTHEENYRDKVVEMWMRAVKNRREFNEIIYYKKPDGTRFPASAVAFVISGSHGMFGHFGEIVPIED